MIEVGRICLKTAGREAGRYCVVIKNMDESFVMVTGPKELTSVKRRRCNVNHLEPLMETIKIKSDASDSEVLKAFQQSSLIDKLGMGPGIAKPAKPKPVPKAEPPKAEKPKAEPKKEEAKKPAPKKTAPKKAPAKKAPAKKPAKAPAKKTPAKKAKANPAKKPAPKKAPAKKKK